MLDIFHNDAFSVVRLTARINDLPYVPGQISDSGLFDTDGIDTLYVGVEKRPEGLGLVGPTPRGGPGETIMLDQDNLRLFPVPHYQRDESLNADEVQGRRAFGTENDLETIQQRMDRKIDRHLRDFDATLEHQRVGALKGIVLDKFGNVMINLFTQFEIAQPANTVFHMPPASAASVAVPSIRRAMQNIRFAIEDTLDRPYTAIEAWCGRDFYTALTESKEAYETFKYQQGELLRGTLAPDSFVFADVTWRRYRTGTKATVANGNVPFIAANEARFVIKGVPDLFMTRFAPADYMETVNTIGLPRYQKIIPRNDDKGVMIQVQMNPISLCTRPELLFTATFDTNAS